MYRRLILAISLVASGSLHALTYNTYTDRATWEAAVGTVVTEDFNAETVADFSGGRGFATFAAINTNANELTTGVRSGGDSANVDGTNFLYFYSDCDSTDGMELHFYAPVTAVGFDWRNTDGSGDIAQMVVMIDGQEFQFGPPGNGFFGIHAQDGSFSTVEIQDTPNQGGCVLQSLGLDDIAHDTSDEDLGTETRFRVVKSFSDGNDAEVDVMLSCNSGNPLEQPFTIAGGGDGVNFVVENMAENSTCEVTETSGPDGYTALLNGQESCLFEDVIVGGQYFCFVENVLDPVDWVVSKEWEFSEADTGIPQDVFLELECENFRQGPYGNLGSGTEGGLIGAELGLLTTVIYPNWTTPATRCRAIETQVDNAIESDQGCADWQAFAVGDEEQSCTITNTVFFEGIPTLSQWGLALMALLMLGIGFIGLRRFA